MKRILFLATMMMATFGFGQIDSEVEQLSSLLKLASQDNVKRDSIVIEIEKIRDNTKSKEIKEFSNKAISSIKEIISLEKEIVYSKSLSDLSKDDLRNFRINEDKFRDISFIHHKREGNFYPYLSIKNQSLNIRLVAFYSGKEWVFFDNVIIVAGDKKYNIPFTDTKKDVGSGGYVYEKGDIWVSPELLQNLRDISMNDTIEIRYDGKRKYDAKLSKQEIITLRDVILLYDKLKK